MSAVGVAASMQPGAPVRWRDLELAAFEAYPSVVRALDPRGLRSTAARSPVYTVRYMVIALASIAPLLSFGFLVFDGGRPTSVEIDGRSAITAAALFTTVGLTMPVWIVWRSLTDRSQLRPSLAGVGAIYVAIGALLAAIVVARAEPGQSLDLALVPFVAMALVGLVLVVVGAISALLPSAEPAQRYDGPLPVVRAAVARLGEGDHAAVEADLTAAISDLERRGVVDRAAASAARQADLGLLAVHMSQAPKG